MSKIAVSRSVLISAPIEKVFNTVNDFSTWTKWSPWLIADPEAKVNVADDKKSYEWEGPRSGSGNMQIVKEDENKSIEIDLQFLKPWKSKAKIHFQLQTKGNQTEATWVMDSSLPFFMFWMKKMMEMYIGMDYDRGLRMLKDFVEDGKVHSKLNFTGKETISEQEYVGIYTSCSIETMGKKMSEDMPRIMDFMNKTGTESAGAPFTQYSEWDLKNNRVEYVSGIPVSAIPSDLPEGLTSGKIPSTPVYTLEHVGPYQHLGNAWSALYNMQRSKEIPVNKKIHPFETYHNNPNEVEATELITRVHFPLK
ncbi:MAG: SRPBCC family protein [Crocinitomicaceae bacterium]|nr:SRPBCC family protein [Crocinitomicaceae bacterium]